MDEPCTCGARFFEEGGFGLDFCLSCGLGKVAGLGRFEPFTPQNQIPGHQSYTRKKRFKKYLCRAMRQQSSCSIPRATWDYLLSKRPYRDTAHIHLTLKRARHLKRKCYDSLPFLTAALCPRIEVPSLDLHEKRRAMDLFRKIDVAISHGPFVSYLFCLEYILTKMGRTDLCEYINHIQCQKRRAKYQVRLNEIFAPRDEVDDDSLMARSGLTIKTQLHVHV